MKIKGQNISPNKIFNFLRGMKNRGFTLVEILVAVAIFSITIGAISGIFVSVLQIQRRGLSNQEIIDSISYNLEYMSRALRMARKQTAQLPSCIDNGLNYKITRAGNGINFLDYQGVCREIYLNGGRIYLDNDNSPLTPTALEVSSLKFNLIGESDADNLQPRVTIAFTIKNKTQDPKGQVQLNIQTTVSQRELDTK